MVGSSTVPFTATPAGGNWGIMSGAGWAHATIDPVTGIATGLAAGTSTIRYTILPGCSDYSVLNVHPMPGPIIGELYLCGDILSTNTTVLSNSVGGGAWTSMNTSVATVDAATGVVTAVASGTAEISYSAGFGCDVSTIVTVDLYPSIGGSKILCGLGSTTTLTMPGVPGTWTSGDVGVATIDPFSGEVTAIGAGTASITYHRASGACDAIVEVFVVADDPVCVHLLTFGSGPSTVHKFRIEAMFPGTTVRFSMVTDPPGCFSTVGLAAPDPIEISPGSGIYEMGPIPAGTGYWAPYYKDILETYGSCNITAINLISFEVANPDGASCIQPATCSVSTGGLKPGRSFKDGMEPTALCVSPNPNTGTFSITGQLPCTDACTVEIELNDMLGKVIYSDRVTVANGKLDARVTLGNDVANGVYLVRVKNNDMSEVKRFTLKR